MQKLRNGEVLRRFRIERGLDVKEICVGLCSTSAINYFERGKRIPDILLFERLLERMGVSPEEVSLMVSEDEYEYLTWKEQVYESIQSGQREKLKELMNSDVSTKTYCNADLEKQFYFYAKGIYKGMNQKYKEAVCFLEDAAKQSMPNLFETLEKKVLLSTMEIHILMLYIYYGIKGSILDFEEGKNLFFLFEQYLYNAKSDIHERAKCYPKLICIGLHLFQDNIKEREQMQLCQKAVNMLRENKTFDDITELLRLYIPLLEKRESRELGFYIKQYEVFCDLLKSEGLEIGFQPECLNRNRPKMYLLNEYLRTKRIEKGMTQDAVSDGICTPETYSRIENGLRSPKPKNYQALAERLEIGWCYYRGELDTLELKAFELRTLQRIAEIEGRRYDALDLLDDLEACLDMNSVINYQYVTLCRSVEECRLGKLDIEEACKILENLLYLTHKMDEESSNLIYYSQTELEIIGHWAQFLREQGKYQEGITLCEMVINQMSNSKVDYEQQWNGFSFLFRVLSGLYFAIGEYETSILIAKYIKSVYIKKKRGSNLSEILDEIADNYEHMSEQYSIEYKKLYRYTYYIADFFEIGKIMDFAKKYYEEHFDKEIVWYESYFSSTSLT